MIRRVLFYTLIFLVQLFCVSVRAEQAADTQKPVPIKVGLSVSLSGKYAEFGSKLLEGVQMWADDINRRGALLGRPVKLIYYDDKSDAQLAVQTYERLISTDGVDLLLGPYSSEITLAVSDVVEQHNFPMLATSASAPKIWQRGFKNIFGIYTPANRLMDKVIDISLDKGLTKLALLYAASEYPRGVAEGARQRAQENSIQIVFDQEYPADQLEFSQIIEKMAAAAPDVVIIGSNLPDAEAFVRQAKTNRFAPKILAFSGAPAVHEFLDDLGAENVEGVMSSVQWIRSQKMPGSYDFSFRYKKKYGFDASYHAATGYAAGQILEAAVRLVGEVDKDKLRQQYSVLRFRSLFGHYQVDATGIQIGKASYLMQWQDGERRLIEPGNIAEKPMVYPFPSAQGR